MGIERILLAAQGYIELEMPAEALAELDRLSPADRDREEVLQLRLFVMMRGRLWQQAFEVCSRLRQLFPEGSTGYIHGAFCLHEMGRTAEAKKPASQRSFQPREGSHVFLQPRMLRCGPGKPPGGRRRPPHQL